MAEKIKLEEVPTITGTDEESEPIVSDEKSGLWRGTFANGNTVDVHADSEKDAREKIEAFAKENNTGETATE